MSKQQVTEKSGVHKQWYEDARKVTAKTLPEFIRHLTEDYQHDYGTICHALSAGAIAAASAMDASPTGGITGFQASFVMWGFIQHWTREEGPMRLVKYDDMLYPQHDRKFAPTISKETWERLQKRAGELLAEKNEFAHPSVIAHWQSIVDGVIPFGHTIAERD